MGSGTTAAVAVQHDRQYLGCELNLEYEPLQRARIDLARPSPDLFSFAKSGSIPEPREAA